MDAWNHADWTIKQNVLFLIRTAEMLKFNRLQLLCFREFYKTGQLYWDKHLTLMMFNQCIWDIYAGECLNRKKPHPNWEHNRSTLTCKIQLMRHIETLPSDFNAHHSYIDTCYILNHQAKSLLFTHQSDNKEHFRSQKPCLPNTCVFRERGIALRGRWLLRILA